tara:strand:- start:3182 stop:5152 length:1971 start_codon:yes stop_codon:yes gene_type:complete
MTHRRKSGNKSKKTCDSSPACGKIWDYIYGLGGDYEQYATNIMDICAKDTLSDYKGLTVIIPDKEFIEKFHENIHESNGSISNARRMLRNTIIKRFLDAPGEFGKNDYVETLPIASGVIVPVVKIDKDSVVIGDGVKIKRKDDFNCPKGFRYSIWEVVSGNYTTDVSFNQSRPKRRSEGGSKSISGGSKHKFVVNIGKRLASSSDAKRIGLVANILGEYKASYISSRDQRSPLLEKGVSLYNWLSMYATDVYEKCLLITDIHPGINLLMLILDPHSLITDELLFGSPDAQNVHEHNGWNNSMVTTSPHNEWVEHVNKASKWTNDEAKYLKSLSRLRKKFDPRRSSDMRSIIMSYYENPMLYLKDAAANNEVVQGLEEWYGSHSKYRKLWQDQFRLVATFGFSCLAEVKFVAVDDSDDIFRNMVTFRPFEDVRYDKAAEFSYEGGNYQSRENEFLLSKFFMSTNFGYMPSSMSEADSLCALTADAKGLCAPLDSAIRCGNICNCHKIKYDLFKEMRSRSQVNPELFYGMQWQLNQRKRHGTNQNDESLDKLFDDYTMGDKGGSTRIGGDKFEVGGGRISSKKHHKRKVIQRSINSSDDDSDNERLGDLADMTFYVVPNDDMISSEDAEIQKPNSHKKSKHHKRSSHYRETDGESDSN